MGITEESGEDAAAVDQADMEEEVVGEFHFKRRDLQSSTDECFYWVLLVGTSSRFCYRSSEALQLRLGIKYTHSFERLTNASPTMC